MLTTATTARAALSDLCLVSFQQINDLIICLKQQLLKQIQNNSHRTKEKNENP